MLSKQSLKKFNKLLKNCKILCIGDLILDEYVYGDVNRISPEAPVPIILIKKRNLVLGGAGNVAKNIADLGGHVNLICTIGNDEISKKAKKLINKEKNLTLSSFKIDGFKLPIKTRFINKSNQLLRTDEENIIRIDSEIQQKIVKKIKSIISNYDLIVLSDYCKGTLNNSFIRKIIKIARENSIKIIIDPKSKDFGTYKGADFITPNYKELVEAMNVDIQTSLKDTVLVKLCKEAINKFSIKNIILTRSDKGIMSVNKNNFHSYPAYAREVYDVTGAGDTVLAMLSLCIAKNVNLNNAIHLANYAAGIVVGKTGTASTNFQEIEKFIEYEK